MAGDIYAFVSENATFDLVVADERIACLDAEIRRLEEWRVEVLVEAQSYRCLARPCSIGILVSARALQPRAPPIMAP